MATPKKPDTAQETLANRSHGNALTYTQIRMIIDLSTVENKKQVEIAETMGIAQSTVSRVLSEFTDTTGIAKLRMKGAAELMAERVIQASQVAAARGDASPALEVLDRVDALPKRMAAQKDSGPRVVVVVGSVNPPQLGDIVVDTKAITGTID